LVPAIRKTADLVQEVATASREQAGGVAQVNRAMAQVDQVAQRNSAAAEELSATAQQMAQQAEKLEQLMGFFTGTSASATPMNAFETVDIAASLPLRAHGAGEDYPGFNGRSVRPIRKLNGFAQRPKNAANP
jgi:hypothetical protein